MKGLQERNMGFHHHGSRGYAGKRPISAKEDVERESLGILDPLAEFTVLQEHDVLRARHHWDSVKMVFETDPVTMEFMRLLVILVSDQFDYMFTHICKQSLFLLQREQHRIADESDSPSEALARPKWSLLEKTLPVA